MSRDSGTGGADSRAVEWIRRLDRSEKDAEEVYFEIFEAYYPRLCQLFPQRGAPPAAVDDLAQETLVRVCRHLRSYRGESSFTTWVYSVAANVDRGRRRGENARKRSASESSLDRALPVDEPGDDGTVEDLEAVRPDRLLLSKEMYDRAMLALQELPVQMRRCFYLRFQQELKYREIADVMRISIQTVKSHLHSARERLKAVLVDDVPRG